MLRIATAVHSPAFAPVPQPTAVARATPNKRVDQEGGARSTVDLQPSHRRPFTIMDLMVNIRVAGRSPDERLIGYLTSPFHGYSVEFELKPGEQNYYSLSRDFRDFFKDTPGNGQWTLS